MKKFVTYLLIFFFYFEISILAVSNPMFNSSKPVEKITLKSPIKAWIMKTIAPAQRNLNSKISKLIKKVKTDKKTVFIVLFLSFIYGLIHALGPGHGKIIMSSYFLSKKSKLKEGIASGFIIASTHSISAIVLISSIYILIKHSIFRTFENTSKIIAFISYGILIFLGLFLFIRTLYLLFKNKDIFHTHSQKNKINYLHLAFITGLVPCPGAATVIIFSLSSGLFLLGILSVLAMSLGMAIVISGFTILAVLFQGGIIELVLKDSVWKKYFFISFKLIGTFAIFLLGLLLLLANINLIN